MLEIFACLTNAGGGGKTRFSCSTVSMFDDMFLLQDECRLAPVRMLHPMTTIQREHLVQSVADALQFISYYHPADYIRALGRAYEREQSPAAKDAIAQILTNSRMCAEGHLPICQDTGIVNVFLKVGMNVRWQGFERGLEDAVNDGVRRAYQDPQNTLRPSIVDPPEGARRNTRDNTPAVIQV